ncbi:MAG: DUF3592 domain-containing protein [Bacteroidota bacterium]
MFILFALVHALPPSKLEAAYSRPSDVVTSQATVVNAEVNRRVSGISRTRVTYRCEVRARYRAGGIGRTVTVTISSGSQSIAERECAEFEPGFKHEVFYSRSDPSNASLLPGYFATPVSTTVILSLGPLGLLLIWIGRRRLLKYKRRYGSYRPI